MQQLKYIFRTGKLFLILYLVLVLFAATVLICYSKASIHLAINSLHTHIFDVFFTYFTNVGDGLFISLIAVCFLFYKTGVALCIEATYVVSGLVVQLLKRFVYPNAPRPKLFFQGVHDLYFVKGLEIHTSNSFPSGHSASAFALFLCLSLLFKNKYLQIVSLCCACLVAYSRMYLSQHFLMDTFTGSIIGVTTVLLYYPFHLKIQGEWMQVPIYKGFGKKRKQHNTFVS